MKGRGIRVLGKKSSGAEIEENIFKEWECRGNIRVVMKRKG